MTPHPTANPAGPTAVFLLNLLQDVNIVRPLVIMAALDLRLPTRLLISSQFLALDSEEIWRHELADLAALTGCDRRFYATAAEAVGHLQGGHGVVVAASESSLPTHALTSDVFRLAPPQYLKLTLQHGFECVGFRQSLQHDLAHGRVVTFQADVVCGWSDPAGLPSLHASQRSKLAVTGPTSVLQRPSSLGGPVAPGRGLVCENLHSVRLSASGDLKADFISTFTAFAGELAAEGRDVALRPHPGGQYVLRSGFSPPANVVLDNRPIYTVDLSHYSYGISAPSSVLIDLVLAGVPTAVWRDSGAAIDTRNYRGLTEISSVADWVRFSQMAITDRARILAQQQAFLDDLRMPTDPADVYRRYAEVLRMGLRGRTGPCR